MNNTQTSFQPAPEWVGQLQHAINTVKTQQDAMMDLMRGNKMNPDDKGMLGNIKDLKTDTGLLEERIIRLEKERDRAVAWMAGAVCVGGLAVTVISLLFKLLSKT